MRNLRMMLALGGVALIAMCEPALSQPPKAKSAQLQNKPAKNKNLANRAQREANANRLRSTAISAPPKMPMMGWPALVREARKYMGTNPTARDRLWCATFMNMVLAKVGYSGTNSDAARSFAQYGRRIHEPKVGAIVVLTRGKTGGHVGVVSGVDPQGNPIIISGNHGRKVGEAIYPRSRVIAYVMPTDRGEPRTQLAVATPRGNDRAQANDNDLDSPIAELLAVIEAEYNAKGRPKGTGPEPRPVPRSQAHRGDLPLDPALAEFLGLTERKPMANPQTLKRPPVPQQEAARPLPPQAHIARAQAPAAPAPRREMRVEHTGGPGRVMVR